MRAGAPRAGRADVKSPFVFRGEGALYQAGGAGLRMVATAMFSLTMVTFPMIDFAVMLIS